MKYLLLILSLPAFAAVTGVHVASTHNVAIFTYTAPSAAACVLEVSSIAGYTPLVYDVDPALFAGAGTDSGGARPRVFVVGKMVVATALDGLDRSRGLQTNTTHYYRITCAGDTATGTFLTKNLPLGMTWVPNADTVGATGAWKFPYLSGTDRAQETIDPITGALFKRTLMPRDALDEYPYGVLTATGCTGAAWTTPNNCFSDDASYAVYSGTTQEVLVAQVSTTVRSSFVGLDFVTVTLNGVATGVDRTVSICLSKDSTTCLGGAATDLVMPAVEGNVSYNISFTVGQFLGWTAPSISDIQNGYMKLLIWKKASSAGTVSIDNILIYWGESKIGLPTSGGFHDICGVVSTDGWTQCVINGQLYGIRLADGLVRTLGGLTFLNASIAGLYPSGGNDCGSFGGGSRLWHQSNPNYILCNASLVAGGLTLVRFTTDSTNTEQPIGAYDTWFVYSSPLVLLPAGYDLLTLLFQFDPTLPTGFRCGFDAVQGNYAIGTCRAGQQDTWAYTFAFSLGNGTAMDDASCGSVTAGKCSLSGVGIVAVNKVFSKPICRWCTFHTLHSQGNTPVMSYETQGTPGTLPYGNNAGVSVLTAGISDVQTAITVTSAWITGPQARGGTITSSGQVVTGSGLVWATGTTIGDTICGGGQCRVVAEVLQSNSGIIVDVAFSPDVTGVAWTNEWSAVPGGWQAGEPVSAKYPHFLQTVAVGDYFWIDTEKVRLTAKTSSTQWVIERGCSYWQGPCTGTGVAHTAVDIGTTCNANTLYGNALAFYWNFVADPAAADSNVGDPTNSGNHALAAIGALNGFSGSHQTSRGQARVMANYDIMAVPTGMLDRMAWAANSNYSLNENYPFADIFSPNGGNTYQRHPSNQHMNLNNGYLFNWFSDVTPFVGGTGFVQPSTPSTQVEGTLYKVGQPDPNLNPNSAPTRKYLPTMTVCGYVPLQDISSPTSHIVTSTTDYTYCYAERNGECRGSGDVGGAATAGQHFMNCPIINRDYCTAGENYVPTNNDTCVGNLTFDGNATVQYGFSVQPNASTVAAGGAKLARTLAKMYDMPRGLPGTANAKPTPDGGWLLSPGVWAGNLYMLLLKNPGMPPFDSINRQTFVPVNVKVPVLAGVDNAYVEFGYDSNLYCTSRAESCVAAASNNPYFFLGESFTGVSCAAGCTISVPSIPSRVLKYRVVLRNGSAVVRRSAIYNVAVP